MKVLKSLFVLAVVSLFFAGCAQTPIKGTKFGTGSIYSEVEFNDSIGGDGVLTGKVGEACAKVILGAIATGDASVATAARNGGITKIAAVDGYNTHILGLFGTYCTRVLGE